jgi:predicted N-acyltransferase
MSGVDFSTAGEYRIRVHEDPGGVDAQAWDALLQRQLAPTPFMRHAWLLAMHRSGSAVPATGWSPRFVTLESGSGMVGAAAIYLKTHSYGEYVFDWAWADAYRRHGLRYYPKLLGASPFTPVPGARRSRRRCEPWPTRPACPRHTSSSWTPRMARRSPRRAG